MTSTRPLPWWLPRLAQQHPGYFKVVIALFGTHIGFGVDALFINPQRSNLFEVLAHLFGGHLFVLAVFHFLIAALILVGLYIRGQFYLMRFGSALSAVVFNVMAVGLAFSATDHDLSYALPIACVALSLSSVAAAREPEDGPRAP